MKVKDKVVSTRVNNELYEQLESLANEKDFTVSKLVFRILESYFDECKNK